MRLQIVPPPVRPTEYPAPGGCPYPGCGSPHVQFRQAVPKPVRDLRITAVIAHRYQCPRCGRTFRVYPTGISPDQTSARLKGLAVMFYALGMSYGAVAIALGALGCPLSKVAVYNAVQAAGAAVAGLRREALARGGGCVRALGVDLTSVRCRGQWLTVGVSVDAVSGLVLTVDLLPNAEAATLTRLGGGAGGGGRGRDRGQRRRRRLQGGGRRERGAAPSLQDARRATTPSGWWPS